MTTTPTYYSPGAAAALLGVTRANFNIWVAKGQQDPDAVLVPASADRKPQPVWTAETVKNWGKTEVGEPQSYYPPQAAAQYLGIPYPTFNVYRRSRGEIPADAWVRRSPEGEPSPVWKPATLKAWLASMREQVAAPHTPRPVGLYGLGDAAGLMNLTAAGFERLLAEHPLAPDAVLITPSTERAWTSASLNGWAEATETPIKRRKPTPVQLYPHTEAAKLLGMAPGDFDKALRAHPLAPEALMASPAAQAWGEDTLRTWAAQVGEAKEGVK